MQLRTPAVVTGIGLGGFFDQLDLDIVELFERRFVHIASNVGDHGLLRPSARSEPTQSTPYTARGQRPDRATGPTAPDGSAMT